MTAIALGDDGAVFDAPGIVTSQQSFLTISATGAATEGVPTLTITANTWAINDQPIAESDIPFRLSALSAHSQAIVIEHTPTLNAERLTQALETVNQAGFAQVGVRTARQ